MATRREVVLGLTAGLMAWATPVVLASDELLLRDILYGVSDALVRDYIRDHYREGRWDGHYWWHDGHRYTPHEYRIYFCDRYDHKVRKLHKKWHKHRERYERDDDDDDDDDDRRPGHRGRRHRDD